ncbi:MAG: hypothetical protein WCL44_04940 [bacterium]
MKRLMDFTIAVVLFAGVTVQSSLALSPADIPGLELWLDASRRETVRIMAGRVAKWKDLSTNEYDAVQQGEGFRPVYVEDVYGDMPMVSFSSRGEFGGNFLQTQCIPARGGDPRTIITAVANVRDTPWKVNHVIHYGSPRIRQAYGLTSKGSGQYRWGNSYWADGFGTDISSTDCGAYIIVASYSNGVDRFTINGGPTVSNSVPLDTAAGAHGTFGIIVGARIDPYFGQPTEAASVDMGEVMAFSRALSVEERQEVEGYLAHKWGMAGMLPSGHPYRAREPALTTDRLVR